MISKYNEYLPELHNRNYCIYDDSEAEKTGLQELHDNSYMILDEDETLNLMIDYEDEFDRLSHKVSFASLQKMAEKRNVFESKPKPVVKEKKEVKVETTEREDTPSKNHSERNNNHCQNDIEVKPKDEKGLKKSDAPKCKKEKVAEQPVKKKTAFEILAEYTAKRLLFYIRREFDVDGPCDATGHYDPVSKSFILHKDSILSLEVASKLRYSALDVQRRLFIKKHCIKKYNGYRLLHDTACASPDQAASFVLGIHADGWKEWIGEDGKQLGEVYNITTDSEL